MLETESDGGQIAGSLCHSQPLVEGQTSECVCMVQCAREPAKKGEMSAKCPGYVPGHTPTALHPHITINPSIYSAQVRSSCHEANVSMGADLGDVATAMTLEGSFSYA